MARRRREGARARRRGRLRRHRQRAPPRGALRAPSGRHADSLGASPGATTLCCGSGAPSHPAHTSDTRMLEIPLTRSFATHRREKKHRGAEGSSRRSFSCSGSPQMTTWPRATPGRCDLRQQRKPCRRAVAKSPLRMKSPTFFPRRLPRRRPPRTRGWPPAASPRFSRTLSRRVRARRPPTCRVAGSRPRLRQPGAAAPRSRRCRRSRARRRRRGRTRGTTRRGRRRAKQRRRECDSAEALALRAAETPLPPLLSHALSLVTRRLRRARPARGRSRRRPRAGSSSLTPPPGFTLRCETHAPLLSRLAFRSAARPLLSAPSL